MKLEVEQSVFLDALRTAHRASAVKSPLDVLTMLYVEAGDGSLTVRGTDLQTMVSVTAGAVVSEPGRAVLASEQLLGFTGGLSGGRLSMNVNGNYHGEVKAGTAHARVPGLDPETFPLPFGVDEGQVIEISVSALVSALSATLHAADRKGVHPSCAGVLFRTDGSDLILAAADGFRAAEARIQDVEADVPIKSTIEWQGLQDVRTILAKTSAETVTLRIDDHVALFDLGSTQIGCRLIGEAFPDYEKMVPVDNAYLIKAPVASMLDGLKLLAPFCSYKWVTLNVEPELVELASRSNERGEGHTSVPCESNGSFSFFLNHDYFTEALDALGSDTADIYLGERRNVLTLKSPDGLRRMLVMAGIEKSGS